MFEEDNEKPEEVETLDCSISVKVEREKLLRLKQVWVTASKGQLPGDGDWNIDISLSGAEIIISSDFNWELPSYVINVKSILDALVDHMTKEVEKSKEVSKDEQFTEDQD